jgi:Holliday junction resolvasome RuvABC endonuclease subunit
MISLGLDPSLSGFGWCIHDSSVAGPGRVVAKGVEKTSSKTVFIRRYTDLRDLVARLLRDHPEVEAVGVESTVFGEQWSPGLYGLFVMVNEAVYLARKDVVHFDPGTVKMLTKVDPAIRRGRMTKTDMIEAARADTGVGRWNHNEADAYHVARFAARFWEFLKKEIVETDLTPAEYRAFARVHTFERGQKAGRTEKTGAAFKEGQRFFRFSELPLNVDAAPTGPARSHPPRAS